jgi:hypothetical protein
MLIQDHRLFLPTRGKDTNKCDKKERLPLWNVKTSCHTVIAHISKLLGRPLKAEIPILPAQTAILITGPIPRVFIKRQQTRFALIFHIPYYSKLVDRGRGGSD